MFSHLTDWELAIYGLVIAIFIVKPLPLFPAGDTHSNFHIEQQGKSSID